MAPRQVLTPEGEKHFKKPVGSEIGTATRELPEPRPVTVERLQSLQRQIRKATDAGNESLLKTLRETFRQDLLEFADGKTMGEAMSMIVLDAAGKSDG